MIYGHTFKRCLLTDENRSHAALWPTCINQAYNVGRGRPTSSEWLLEGIRSNCWTLLSPPSVLSQYPHAVVRMSSLKMLSHFPSGSGVQYYL